MALIPTSNVNVQLRADETNLSSVLTNSSGDYEYIWQVSESDYNRFTQVYGTFSKTGYITASAQRIMPSFADALSNGIRLDGIIEAGSVAQFYITPTSATYAAAGETKTVVVTCPDNTWTMALGGGGDKWFEYSRNGNVVTFTAPAYTGTIGRNATIVFSWNGLSIQYRMNQLASTEDTGTIRVSGTVTDSSQVTVTPIPNAFVELIRAIGDDPILTGYTDSSGKYSFDWTVTSFSYTAISRLSIRVSATNYNQSSTVIYDTSTTPGSRPAYDDAVANGLTGDAALQPNSNKTFWLEPGDPDGSTFNISGDTKIIYLHKLASDTYTYRLTSNTVDGTFYRVISVVDTSPTLVTFSIQFDPNITIIDRTALLSVTRTNTTPNITVTTTCYQNAGSDAPFDVQPKSFTVRSGGETYSARVYTNVSDGTWSASLAEQNDYVRLDQFTGPASGAADTLGIKWANNPLNSSRTGTINVTRINPLPQIIIPITYTQEATSSFIVIKGKAVWSTNQVESNLSGVSDFRIDWNGNSTYPGDSDVMLTIINQSNQNGEFEVKWNVTEAIYNAINRTDPAPARRGIRIFGYKEGVGQKGTVGGYLRTLPSFSVAVANGLTLETNVVLY
jgi:hypothetical protein